MCILPRDVLSCEREQTMSSLCPGQDSHAAYTTVTSKYYITTVLWYHTNHVVVLGQLETFTVHDVLTDKEHSTVYLETGFKHNHTNGIVLSQESILLRSCLYVNVGTDTTTFVITTNS